MSPVPFTDFLLYLREQGLPIGVSAHLAVAKLVAGWEVGNRTALRDALAALLARSPSEQQLIQERFDLYYSSPGQNDLPIPGGPHEPRSSSSSRPPPPPARASVETQFAIWGGLALGICLLLIAAVILARYSGHELPQLPDAASVPFDLGVASPPAVTVPPVDAKTQTARPLGAAVAFAGLVFSLAFAGLYAARRLNRRSEMDRQWAAEQLARLPGPQHYRWKLRQLRSPLGREDIEEFCTLLHRLCAEPGAGRELDVERTVEWLARTGQLTTVSHRRRPLRRPIVLLLDYGRDTRVFAAKLDALEQGIARRGIPAVRWFFDDDPSQLSTAPYGPQQSLGSVVGEDRDTPILIATYGSELADPETPLPSWVGTLRGFPRCALLHPIADPEAWPRRLQHGFPLPVWPMNRLGLRGAAHALAHDRALRLNIDRTRLRVDTAIDQASVRGLLRLVALAPRPTIEIVELLRQLYYPEVPEQVLLHIAHATAAAGTAQLRVPAQQQAILVSELRLLDRSKEQAARRTLLEALADSLPPVGSVAELRWRLDCALQALHLRSEDGATADTAAVQAAGDLAELAASPICEEVADKLRGLTLPGDQPARRAMALEAPLTPDAVQRLRQARTPVYGKQSPGSAVWPRPGTREVVVGLVAALIVWMGLWGLGWPKGASPPPSLSSPVDLSADLPKIDVPPVDLRPVEPPADLRPSDLRAPIDLSRNGSPPMSATAPRIIIDSLPPAALVFLDGAFQGQSGPNFAIPIPKGQHWLRLELEGSKPFQTMVNITRPQKLTFPLEVAPARLDIKTPVTNDSAKGGEVFIDEAPAGVVPVIVDLPPGRHLIRVRKQGQMAFTERVELKAGEWRPVWVIMQADQPIGSLLVAADVTADVLVDGQPRGEAPLIVENLYVGEHLVEVRRKEPGAPPWRQTVRVMDKEQTKVFAQTTPAPPAPPRQGWLMVICNVPDAEVNVDGQVRGTSGKPISLPPGQHVVLVSAKGYKPVRLQTDIDIDPGKPNFERINLEVDNATRKVGTVRIIMTKPVDGAQYFINGRKLDETAALSDQGVEVPAGNVIVVVKKDGFGLSRKELNLVAGTTETVQIELRNVGRIYFASEPKGAYVILDKFLIGQTPLTKDGVSVGPHTYELQMQGMETATDTIQVVAGDVTNVATIMRPQMKQPARLDVQALASSSKKTYDGGEILVDNTFAGKVPLIIDLPSGHHALQVRKEGLSLYSQDLDLAPGKTQRVVLTPPAEDPDANNGPSAKRDGGLLLSLNVARTDSVSWPRLMRTRWFRINIEKPLEQTILECQLRVDDAGVDLNIDFFNSLGTQIGFSPGPTPNKIKKLAVQLDEIGSYFVRIQAALAKDQSAFSIICR